MVSVNQGVRGRYVHASPSKRSSWGGRVFGLHFVWLAHSEVTVVLNHAVLP